MRTSATCPVCAMRLTCANVPRDYFHFIRCPRCLTKLMVRMRFLWVYLMACLVFICAFGSLLFLGVSREVIGLIAIALIYATFKGTLLVYFTFGRLEPAERWHTAGRFTLRQQAQADDVPLAEHALVVGHHELRYTLYANRLRAQLIGGTLVKPLTELDPLPVVHREMRKPFLLGVVLVLQLVIVLLVCVLSGYGAFITNLTPTFVLVGVATIGLMLMIRFRRQNIWARFFVKETWEWVDVFCSTDEETFESFVRNVMCAIQTAQPGAGTPSRDPVVKQ